MNKNKKHSSKNFLASLLNVRASERSAVLVSWLLRFFLHTGIVLGTTVIIALFVARFGISKLPYLLIFQALLISLGTSYFSHLVKKFSTHALINFTILISAILIGLGIFSHNLNSVAFIVIVTLAQAVFITQLEICILSYTEDLFSPTQGARVFPIIESGELFGGITGGVLTSVLVYWFSVPEILVIWIFSLLAIALLIRFYQLPSHDLSQLYEYPKKSLPAHSIRHKLQHKFAKVGKSLKIFRQHHFIRNLVLVIGVFWICHHLIQFQFTQYVASHVQATMTFSSKAAYESELVHSIAKFEAILHASALVIQFFIASRIISSLGMIRSLLIHPVIVILSALSLLMLPRFVIALILRNNLEIGSIIHLNTYHNAYYVIPEEKRSQLREIFEGFIKPAGAIIGMVIVIGLGMFLVDQQVAQIINVILIAILIISISAIHQSSRSYSKLARKNLRNFKSPQDQISALEITQQKGHNPHYQKVFIKDIGEIIRSNSTSAEVLIAALETAAKIQSDKLISPILAVIKHPNHEVRRMAIHALHQFNNQKLKGIVSHIKEHISNETNAGIRRDLIRLLAKLNKPIARQFFLKNLESSQPMIPLSATIYGIGLTKKHQDRKLLKPYLENPDFHVRSMTLLALWKLHYSHQKLIPKILRHINSAQTDDQIISKLLLLSKVNFPHIKHQILPTINHPNPNIQLHSAIDLGKKGCSEAIEPLSKIYCHPDPQLRQKARLFIHRLNPKLQNKIKIVSEKLLAQRVQEILSQAQTNNLQQMPISNLQQLHDTYLISGDHRAIKDTAEVLLNKQQPAAQSC